MEDYRESTVVVTRFWDDLLKLAPSLPVARPMTYAHGMYALFLFSEHGVDSLCASNDIYRTTIDSLVSLRASVASRRDAILSWLGNSGELAYAEKIAASYKETMGALRYQPPGHYIFRPEDRWLRAQFRQVGDWTAEHGVQLMLDAFDYGHAELTRGQRDPAREDFAACLALSCTFGAHSSFAELFSPTARFTRLAASSRNVRWSVIAHDTTDHFTAMRLHMQDVGLHYINLKDMGRDGIDLPGSVDFLLLDPTPMAGDKINKPNSDEDANPMSPIGLAQQLLKSRGNFGLALLVVPHLDSSTKNWQKHVRRDLVESRRLAAVVDLPASALTGRRRFSAWLVTGRHAVVPTHRDHVLFIDAEPLSRLTPVKDAGITTDFIGALIAPIFDQKHHQDTLLGRLQNAEPLLANIFRREFDHDRYEAPGLARSVSIDEMAQHDYVLEAKAYLTPGAGDLWDRGIDRRQLDALLERHGAAGKRMYIIGNNGEGKSLLLRDIALENAAQQRRTVVIAFGASDRFPKRIGPRSAPFYRYMGARTSTTGINTLQAAVDVGALMLRIHADEQRLRVLDRVLDLIGFASQLFLIPKELKANNGQQRGLISGIVRLASEDRSDLLLIEKLRASPGLARKYKLGLRRANHRDSILPFDELSSGEQQIIALAAKMISEAARKVLFLVDEPEISLHVGWQRAVPKLLELIAREFRTDILVATHSPILVASADSDGDHCFTVRDRALNELSLEDRNSVETALFEGFRTYTSNNREVHERCASLVARFIDSANGEEDPQQAVQPVLEKLDDMKRVIEHQRRFAAQEEMAFDVNLIERAKAAVKEMAELAADDAGRGVE